MRYRHLVLSALAASVTAKDNGGPKKWIIPPSNELPVIELRDVPALPRHVAMGVADQDIPPPTMAANANDNSGYKIKRTPCGVVHQPHKCATCDPLPTLPNTYKINLADAQSVRSGLAAASVANNADPAPTGYYQTFKDLQGSTSATNLLGTIAVNTTTGYDVDFCACPSRLRSFQHLLL
jgi:hypothetical protein